MLRWRGWYYDATRDMAQMIQAELDACYCLGDAPQVNSMCDMHACAERMCARQVYEQLLLLLVLLLLPAHCKASNRGSHDFPVLQRWMLTSRHGRHSTST
jgi:hypothetical protein